jgi:YD repeat-containing protein
MMDPGGTTTYAYDVRSSVTRESRPGGYVTTMGYDAVGNRTTLIDPDGGRFTYTYDAINRIELVIDPDANRTTFMYDRADRRTTMVDANGSTRKYQYDNVGRLTTQIEYVTSSNLPFITLIDGYDAVGNRVSHVQDGVSTTWVYDDIYRLIRQEKSGERATFSYDAVGNILTKHHQGSSPMSFTYDDADRIVTMIQGTQLTTFTYDNTGNLTAEHMYDNGADNETFSTYSYDHENRLVVAKEPPTTVSTYTYDGDGLRRTSKSNTGEEESVLTTFIWDGADYLGEY